MAGTGETRALRFFATFAALTIVAAACSGAATAPPQTPVSGPPGVRILPESTTSPTSPGLPFPNPTGLPFPGSTAVPLPIPGSTGLPLPNPTGLPFPNPTAAPLPFPTSIALPGPTIAPPVAVTNAGPPGWVTPGTRVMFYSAAASVAQSRFQWVEDPNGTWEDPKTGKKYRRTDESGEGVGTGSGDGLDAIDVLAVEGTNVVISYSLYGIDHTRNLFVIGPSGGSRVAGDVVDGSWIQPAELAQLQNQSSGTFMVLRGDWPIGTTTYHAVSFANTATDAYWSYTYDTETGLLLDATTSTAGATSPLSAPGEGPPQGNTELTVTHLAGVRQRAVPGWAAANPAWVARTRELDYSGTYSWTNPVDPSSGTLNYPMSETVSLGQGGANWAPYSVVTDIGLPGLQPTTSSGVTGPGGLYWFDPGALAGMKAGQTIDQDPLLGERDVVASVDPGPSGTTVTIASDLPGASFRSTYDVQTGVLVAYQGSTTATTGITIQLQLQSMP